MAHERPFNELSEHTRYVIQSSDVIDDLRIQVREDGTDNVIWYKERFLSDEEIIENVVENATSKLCWTIHTPKRGWYLRLRSPAFPTGVFINLSPVPHTSPFHAEGALSFQCRVNAPKSPALPTPPAMEQRTSREKTSLESLTPTLTGGSDTTVHSYPPTPPPPSSPLDDGHTKSPSILVSGPSEVRQFLLAPHSSPHVPQPETTSFLTRALAAFKNNKPSHSSSFTLCPLPLSGNAPLTNHQHATSVGHSRTHPLSAILPPAPPPLLTFHDRTPAWNFRSTTGLLEIDAALEREAGVDRSFWIAVGLAYVEFLVERESYLAAAGG